jgi:hypothetical protein
MTPRGRESAHPTIEPNMRWLILLASPSPSRRSPTGPQMAAAKKVTITVTPASAAPLTATKTVTLKR